MKILVTGAKGQLGCDVIKRLNFLGISALGVGKHELDITDSYAVQTLVKEFMPDAVIHCAAYTAVDKAENQAELCYKVNATGSRNVAQACKIVGAKMLYISTDYVFPGTGEKAYEVNDPKGPLNVYGDTKLRGEEVVQEILDKYFIVRTSWVFGKNGNNFVKTMLRLGQTKDEISVVCDQIGSPTYTVDLAALLCDMVVTEQYGTYHATNENYCSWAEFAQEILKRAGYETKVNFISTSAYPTKAKRPFNSRLSKKSLDKAGFSRLPVWQDALSRYFKESRNDS